MSVLKLAPNFGQKSEVLFKLAVIFGKTYQLDQAINYFRLALLETQGPAGANRRIDIYKKAGICYMEKKEYTEALKSFENALSISDQNYLTYQHIAWCQFMMEKYSQALENVNKAIAFKAEDGDGYYIKGRILLAKEKCNENKDAKEAREAFNRAISIDPKKAVYLGSLGILNCLIKSDAEAFENFLKATQLDSSIPETWFNIGLLYEAHDQSVEAAVAYQKAIDVASDFAPASARKAEISNPSAAKSSLPQFIHPEFHVADPMVPLKSYLNNQKIKKALEPGMVSSGHTIRNILNESSLPPPEDGLKLTPAAVRLNEDDKENPTETKFREEKKQVVKEKKKENVEEHTPIPIAPQPEKQEVKPLTVEQSKQDLYTSKVTQPVTMVTSQPPYLTIPKVIRPAPTLVSNQTTIASQPPAPVQPPSIHPSVTPQVPIPSHNPSHFDISTQVQYGLPIQQPSLAQLVQQLTMNPMSTAQTMSQTQQMPQGQPMTQISSTGFSSNPHAAQSQSFNLLSQFLQLVQHPQLQPYLPALLNQIASMVQPSNSYMVPSYPQSYMGPSKSPYPQNMPYASSAPSLGRAVHQVTNEMQPHYQFSLMPRGPMPPSYGISGFPQMHRPEAPSMSTSVPMNLTRPSYSVTDQAQQYAHQEQPHPQQHIQEIINPTPIIPARPIAQHPKVVPALRLPSVKPTGMQVRTKALDDLMKMADIENKGLKAQGFQRAGQECYGREFESKGEEHGNVVKLAISPQKSDDDYYSKRRKPENEMGREGIGNYDQANKRYKGDQNE